MIIFVHIALVTDHSTLGLRVEEPAREKSDTCGKSSDIHGESSVCFVNKRHNGPTCVKICHPSRTINKVFLVGFCLSQTS